MLLLKYYDSSIFTNFIISGGLFKRKHNTRRVLKTDDIKRVQRTENTRRELQTANTRHELQTDNIAKRIVCILSDCESFTCEPINECDGVIKRNGGFCGCCDICVIQLGKLKYIFFHNVVQTKKQLLRR